MRRQGMVPCWQKGGFGGGASKGARQPASAWSGPLGLRVIAADGQGPFKQCLLQPASPPPAPGRACRALCSCGAEDEQQERHHIRGWQLEAVHAFESGGPTLGLVKRVGAAAVGARYSLADSTASLHLQALGVALSAGITRTGDGWHAPALSIAIQPFAFL
jgi:hypothetical protein